MLSNPSLCIPRVEVNFNKEDIISIFQQLQFGKIERVDVIHKKNRKGQDYKCVFIHFKYWYNSEKADKIKERILSKNDVKIVYEFPWFWNIYFNKK